MSIQFVIVPKAALFETDEIADRYDEFFREAVSYSFPDDFSVSASDLSLPVKQMFLASMHEEIGDNFFGGKRL